MRLSSLVCVCALGSLASMGFGQEQAAEPAASVVTIGSRVRIESTVVKGQAQGLVTALNDSEIALDMDGGAAVKIPLSAITSVDASIGRKRNGLKGLAIGGVAGLLVGLIAPVDANDCARGSRTFCTRRGAVIGDTLAYGLLGMGVGALVKTERWSPTSLNIAKEHVRYEQRGLRLAVTVRF